MASVGFDLEDQHVYLVCRPLNALEIVALCPMQEAGNTMLCIVRESFAHDVQVVNVKRGISAFTKVKVPLHFFSFRNFPHGT